MYNSHSHYKERRFSKLGYSAGSIFDCLPQFEKVFERSNKSNLLISACRIYLECAYVNTALKALTDVTMPFLSCVEMMCDQNQLVEIVPKLQCDLENKIL